MNFDTRTIDQLAAALVEELKAVYAAVRPIGPGLAAIPNIAREGREAPAIATLWREITKASSHLASPDMMGHMDTAPHPVAAMTDALVSALNNNLLFRELSPLASQIEEQLIGYFIEQLGLSEGSAGTFVSGGSLANLTALFAACGGYGEAGRSRADIRLIVGENAHASVRKAAAILGIGPTQIIVPDSEGQEHDGEGRLLPHDLDHCLSQLTGFRKIVVANLGSTIHGAVDPVAELAPIAKHHGAWFHVDAIYGAGLCFSARHRHFLNGLDRADSVVAGPQKWMYTPRLSAMVFLKDRARFDQALAMTLPYSQGGDVHLGQWGVQGSRRADGVTLWMALQAMGSKGVGEMVDRAVAMAQDFHGLLARSDFFEATHRPDLNLLCFKPRQPIAEERMQAAHRALTEAGGPWVSLSSWRGEMIFRSVLLSPLTTDYDLQGLLGDLRRMLT